MSLDGAAELALFRREWIEAEVVVHDQAEPQSQAADLDRLLLNIHAKETVLDDLRLRFVKPFRTLTHDWVLITVSDCFQESAQVHQLVHKADGESARTDRRIAALQRQYQCSHLDCLFRGHRLP